MSTSMWEQALASLRPGSRTLLYRPESEEICLEFARRGFRLMLIHEDESFLATTKSRLRETGLASCLMGSFQLGGRRLSLAVDFYELACLFCEPSEDWPEVKESLRVGCQVVGPESVLAELDDGKVESALVSGALLGFRIGA